MKAHYNDEAKEIIKTNLSLAEKYQNKSIIDMVDEQEILIKKFIKLGFSKKNFFEYSQRAAGMR